MAYDEHKLRAHLQRIMDDRQWTAAEWGRRANKKRPSRTLGHFMEGRTRSPTVDLIYRLAEAAQMSVADVLGLERQTTDAAVQRAVASLLERVKREFAESGEALASIEALLRSESQNYRPPTSSPDAQPPGKDA